MGTRFVTNTPLEANFGAENTYNPLPLHPLTLLFRSELTIEQQTFLFVLTFSPGWRRLILPSVITLYSPATVGLTPVWADAPEVGNDRGVITNMRPCCRSTATLINTGNC